LQELSHAKGGITDKQKVAVPPFRKDYRLDIVQVIHPSTWIHEGVLDPVHWDQSFICKPEAIL
jgi:hypothetical protein